MSTLKRIAVLSSDEFVIPGVYGDPWREAMVWAHLDSAGRLFAADEPLTLVIPPKPCGAEIIAIGWADKNDATIETLPDGWADFTDPGVDPATVDAVLKATALDAVLAFINRLDQWISSTADYTALAGVPTWRFESA